MLTRSEIIDTAKKATRGVGYPWGLAEEGATATLALITAGYDGFAVLSDWLIHVERAGQLPQPSDCVLCRGAYLRDCGQNAAGADHLLIRALCDQIPSAAQTTPWPEHAPKTLIDFAARVYVPESDESRRRGAGGD